jgi:hypothetical protein
VTAVHVPLLVASPHDSQEPPQAALQQTPSAQKPLPHWLAAVHACPAFSLHIPVGSQLFVPLQLSASSALFTATHVPPPPVQAWQAPQEAMPQQWPSTQFPLVHSAAPEHVCPFALLHFPVASHDDIPLHMSSTPDFTGLHVPSSPGRLHALHAVAQALLQQYPSAQKPLAQSLAAVHVWPVAFLATHFPAAQYWPAAQGEVSEHPPAQIVPPHEFGAQSTVSAFGHMPLPSHAAASVATPAAQEAVRHDCAAPGYVHRARLAPSHVPAQGVPAPAHAVCDGRGVPITATHWPFMSGSPHASQEPEHALSQQTPST